jgi:gamma-glutamyl:cysteine ligase YbdK (ATP-grasp superfamily)
MGIEIDKTQFDETDRQQFTQRIDAQLEQLAELLAQPGFGCGSPTVGAELELYVVDESGRPAHRNQALWNIANDPQLTVELLQYNLEYNLSPQVLGDGGLWATEREIVAKLGTLSGIAAAESVGIVPIGILPTLRPEDFGAHCVTDRQRYHALVAQLIALRGADFPIDINGAEPLKMAVADITLEGANTSFQVHYRVNPEDYAATFNAIQLTTPLALAISANSPGLFGHQLWDETRVPLFKQSIDTRVVDRYSWSEPPRVCFGHGWVRSSALELFEETVRLYPPLLPVVSPKVPRQAVGGAPELAELRLHQSTVWLWNRPVYDDVGGGHLRVEMRALPAGPTAVDMVAGAALMLGLAEGLKDRVDALLPALPFTLAEYNFYRSAQHGLSAKLIWPDRHQHRLREVPVTEVIAQMLPLANDGLRALKVPLAERDRYLGIIDARLSAGRNGAGWQRESTQFFMQRGASKHAALASMLTRYRELSAENLPVAQWPIS